MIKIQAAITHLPGCRAMEEGFDQEEGFTKKEGCHQEEGRTKEEIDERFYLDSGGGLS